MRLGTSVSLFAHDPAGRTISTVESLRRCAKAGFQVVDMNFSPILFGKSEFAGDNWEKAAHDIRSEAEKLGLVFSQAHLPYHVNYAKLNPTDDPDFNTQFDECVRRSILCCGILGVKWAVSHPYCNIDENIFDSNVDLKLNREIYLPIFEQLTKQGVGLAIENIVSMIKPIKRRYAAVVDEMCELVDSFQDKNVGVCWDFGHGNRLYKDQQRPLRTIGNRLKATHLNDNMSLLDIHTLPFVCGNINWAKCLPVLTEINYAGDLMLELKFGNNLPDPLKDDYAKLAYEVGCYCLSLAKGEKR